MTDADRRAGQRLQAAFDLFEAALAIQRTNLRRRHPQAADADVEAKLAEWLLRRPPEPDVFLRRGQRK